MSQSQDFSFGSRAYQEYYHGRNNGHRAIGDQASRARSAMKATLTKRGESLELDRRGDEARAEMLAFERLGTVTLDLEPDLQTNLGNDRALTVKIKHSLDLPESLIVSLLSSGFRWSHRRGGMWWAPRTPESILIASRLMEKESEDAA
jgi:hypothetical protein